MEVFKIKIGIIGGSGYTGAELIKLLLNHDKVEIGYISANKYAGHSLVSLFPQFLGVYDYEYKKLEIDEALGSAELFFFALPHGIGMDIIPEFIKNGKKVIDLSADFRLKESGLYEDWYKKKHPAQELLMQSVYGLSEINREEIKKAKLIANPGCYSTSALLGVYPLLRSDLVKEEVIIDAKSGVSGAGRKIAGEYMFSEINENFKAYSVLSHRHQPEIEQEMKAYYQKAVKVRFVPHLLPVDRGILSTIYCDLKNKMKEDDIYEIYNSVYKDAQFINILTEEPSIKAVRKSNCCHISMKLSADGEKIVILSAIDNLVKGASGQAVQNMNLMLGFDESEALKNIGEFP